MKPTLKLVLDRIKAWANAHSQITDFGHGKFSEKEAGSKRTEWIKLFIVVQDQLITEYGGDMPLEFIVMAPTRENPDSPEEDQEILKQVMSDLLQILRDFAAEAQNGSSWFYKNGDPVFELKNRQLRARPFIEQYENTITGFRCVMQLEVMDPFDACAIPYDENYDPPDPPTPGDCPEVVDTDSNPLADQTPGDSGLHTVADVVIEYLLPPGVYDGGVPQFLFTIPAQNHLSGAPSIDNEVQHVFKLTTFSAESGGGAALIDIDIEGALGHGHLVKMVLFEQSIKDTKGNLITAWEVTPMVEVTHTASGSFYLLGFEDQVIPDVIVKGINYDPGGIPFPPASGFVTKPAGDITLDADDLVILGCTPTVCEDGTVVLKKSNGITTLRAINVSSGGSVDETIGLATVDVYNKPGGTLLGSATVEAEDSTEYIVDPLEIAVNGDVLVSDHLAEVDIDIEVVETDGTTPVNSAIVGGKVQVTYPASGGYPISKSMRLFEANAYANSATPSPWSFGRTTAHSLAFWHKTNQDIGSGEYVYFMGDKYTGNSAEPGMLFYYYEPTDIIRFFLRADASNTFQQDFDCAGRFNPHVWNCLIMMKTITSTSGSFSLELNGNLLTPGTPITDNLTSGSTSGNGPMALNRATDSLGVSHASFNSFNISFGRIQMVDKLMTAADRKWFREFDRSGSTVCPYLADVQHDFLFSDSDISGLVVTDSVGAEDLTVFNGPNAFDNTDTP